jgi:uncharacterized damage-inducible protein DinB
LTAEDATPVVVDCRVLASAIADALGQLAAVVASLDADQYCCRSCDPAFGASVGRHVRHVLDHVAAIEHASTRRAPSDRRDPESFLAGCVADYENRARDTRLEREPELALTEISRLRENLRQIALLAPDQPTTILIAVTRDAPRARIPSTLGRELSFVLSHTIHHHAIMRTMICKLGLGASLDPCFGLAPGSPVAGSA